MNGKPFLVLAEDDQSVMPMHNVFPPVKYFLFTIDLALITRSSLLTIKDKTLNLLIWRAFERVYCNNIIKKLL